MATKKQVAFLIFPNFNTLDLNGPQEVLKNYAMGAKQEDQMFDIAVAAFCDITTAFEKVQVKRDISFDDALKSVSQFDVMIVAGGPGEDVDAAIANSNETKMLDLISAFAEQNVDPNRPKWLVSICTGAGFLATCGLFSGKTVTSHWAYLDQLRAICQKYSMPATTVVRERWVNAGVLDGGVKLVTSGGVSCGIDCTLWLLSEIGGAKGMDLANSVALVMDYDWKYPRPNITFGQLV
jgi:transcriptional regulator GlxA family with amidase domain